MTPTETKQQILKSFRALGSIDQFDVLRQLQSELSSHWLAPEPTRYVVTLESVPIERRVEVMSFLRKRFPWLSLSQVKELIGSAPRVLVDMSNVTGLHEDYSAAEAHELKNGLEALGASVRLEPCAPEGFTPGFCPGPG